MPSVPPRNKAALPPNWDLEDEGVGATREVETDELFALSGFLDEPGPPVAAPIPAAPPTTRSVQLQLELEETEPAPLPTSTVRPEVSQADYVKNMMRMAPPSSVDRELAGYSASLEEGFDLLTPWPASVAPEADPEALDYAAAELRSLGQPMMPRNIEDLGAKGTGLGEVDLSEIVPELNLPAETRRRISPLHGTDAEMDELDQMLIHEATQARRRKTELPPPQPRDTRTDLSIPEITVQEAEAEADLLFDEPSFQPPSEAGLERALSLLDMPALGSEIETAPDTVQDLGAVRDALAARKESPLPTRLDNVRSRFEAGDFRTTLILAEAILDEDPTHLPAKCYADACKALLLQMYFGRIGDKTGVPRVVMTPGQIKELLFDNRAGFILSCIDGVSTVDEVLDMSGMEPLDALRILYELLQAGAIEVASPSLRAGRNSRGSRH